MDLCTYIGYMTDSWYFPSISNKIHSFLELWELGLKFILVDRHQQSSWFDYERVGDNDRVDLWFVLRLADWFGLPHLYLTLSEGLVVGRQSSDLSWALEGVIVRSLSQILWYDDIFIRGAVENIERRYWGMRWRLIRNVRSTHWLWRKRAFVDLADLICKLNLRQGIELAFNVDLALLIGDIGLNGPIIVYKLDLRHFFLRDCRLDERLTFQKTTACFLVVARHWNRRISGYVCILKIFSLFMWE